jgi:mandelate racemase
VNLPNLTVRDLRVRAVRVPLDPPHRTASGVLTESPLVLTDLITKEGSIGHSVVFTYTPLALKSTATMIENLQPLLVGGSPQGLYDRLVSRFRLLGPQGLVGIALGAIDMAGWDAVARAQKMPLWRLLGGEKRRIPAYAGVGYDGITGSANAAEHWAKCGFSAVKAKIGYTTAEEDRQVVRAMRSAVGPDVAVMVDYNQLLSVSEAIRRIRMMADEGLTWVEEPVSSQDLTGHAEVAAEVETPIQSGENWWGPLDFEQAINLHASDYLMLDVMKVGGVTGWRQVTTIAGQQRISNHLFPEVSAHLLSATPTAHWIECVNWWDPILQEPLAIENGFAIPGDTPGSGIEWTEDAIAKYLA